MSMHHKTLGAIEVEALQKDGWRMINNGPECANGGWRVCRECTLIRKANKRAAQGRSVRGRYATKATKQRVLQ